MKPLAGWVTIVAASCIVGASVSMAAVDPEDAEKMALMNLRDPFKRPDLRVEAGVARSPLEMVSIDQVKLTGVITGPHRFKAMLQVGDKTYFVSENTKLGARKGYISKINQDSIQVRERIVNLLGKEENLETELHLVSEGKPSGAGN